MLASNISKNGGRKDPRRAQLRVGSQSDDGNWGDDTASGSAIGSYCFVDVLLYCIHSSHDDR